MRKNKCEEVFDMVRKIETPDAPAAIGPYSQAVIWEKLIFVSGQLPVDPGTGVFPAGGIKEQTRQSLENVRQILTAAGSGMDKVLSVTVYLQNMGDFAEMNEVYGEYFKREALPARAAVQAAALPRGAMVEIGVIACT